MIGSIILFAIKQGHFLINYHSNQMLEEINRHTLSLSSGFQLDSWRHWLEFKNTRTWSEHKLSFRVHFEIFWKRNAIPVAHILISNCCVSRSSLVTLKPFYFIINLATSCAASGNKNTLKKNKTRRKIKYER